MAATISHQEKVYRAYMEFFDKAEKKRRWSVFSDIPWDKLDPAKNDENAALCAETFCGVEMYLPDYIAGGLNVLRDSFGQAWFHANWGYEESKHAFSLREYLLRSGQRTQEEWETFETAVLAQKWQLPFDSARKMSCYGMIQEKATFIIYLKQLELAQQREDEVLTAIYRYISRDEAAHTSFYTDVVKLCLEEDREGTLNDLAFVFANFRMPGVGLVPDYDERIGIMRGAGIDRQVFLTKVWFPLLKKAGTSRAELARASRKLSAARREVAQAK